MALTITPINLNPASGGSTAPSARGNAASLKMSHINLTVGVAGDYSAGGIPLTAQQCSMDSGVIDGWGSLLTPGGAGTVVAVVVLVQADGSVKVKANTAAAEAAAAGVAGAVLDLHFLGY